MTHNSDLLKFEDIKKDLEELEKLYVSLKQNSGQNNFEYKLLEKAKKLGLTTEELRKIFQEFYTEKKLLKNIDNWLEQTSFFSLLQRLSTIVGVTTLILGAVTFLPTQQEQKRNQITSNNIERQRSHYEAWNIINSNQVRAGSGRTIALQNLAEDGVSLNGLEVPGAFLFDIDLGGAALYRANFQGADLYRADFSNKPEQNNPKQCNIWIIKIFADCKPKDKLKSRKTELERANFKGAILYEAKFNNTDFVNRENSNSNLEETQNSQNPNVDIYRADFSPLYLGEENKIKNIIETECFMNKPIIQCTRATNAEFIGANLRYADFTKASLKGADFSHADLECASFRGAIFNKEQQESKDLSESIKPTNFTDANLKGADLRDLAISTDGDKRGILPEQIKKAKNWKQAQYSDAFLTDELGLSKEDHQPHNCETFQK
ncbi:MAG: pentapeptide repeat-containing protein [Cyanobacteria bacterium J06621_8]